MSKPAELSAAASALVDGEASKSSGCIPVEAIVYWTPSLANPQWRMVGYSNDVVAGSGEETMIGITDPAVGGESGFFKVEVRER